MIIAMKKATIVALKEDKEKLLESLQRYGEVMLIPPSDERTVRDSAQEDALVARTEKSLRLMQKYAVDHPKSSRDVPYDDFITVDPKRIELLQTIEKADEEILALQTENNALSEKIHSFIPWIGLDFKLSMIRSPKDAILHTGTVESRNFEVFSETLSEFGAILEPVGKIGMLVTVVFAVFREDEGIVLESIKNLGFTEVTLPLENKYTSEIVTSLELKLTNNLTKIEQLNQMLKDCAKQSEELELLADQVASAAGRKRAELVETEATVYLEGWVRSDRIDRFEKSIQSITEYYDLELSDPTEDQKPPTVTKNNRFVSAYESITNMFSIPDPYELDPNPTMAFWYWFIFGMMMGDAGYGAVMIIIIGIMIKKMNPKGNMRKLFLVLFYGGFSTILWGVLYGSYFGYTWNPILVEPMGDPLKMLIISIIVGVIHLISGLLVKAWSNFKKKDYIAVLADSFSWIMMLVGLGMLFLPATAPIGKWIAISGAAIIVLFAGRTQKNPVGRIGLGLYSLYGASSYLGDILSYSRILALAMSSAALAMVMNLLVDMLSTSVIGIIGGVLVFLIGHIFNLAMGLLSAYVHASRLQYIEFFGKFYSGGGYAFTPLEMQLKHIDNVNDSIK